MISAFVLIFFPPAFLSFWGSVKIAMKSKICDDKVIDFFWLFF